MLVIGVTGGIGSGKSAVSAILARRGAVVIDTDAIARLVVEPGEAAHEAVGRRFGEELLDETGAIDRAGLARIVFSDPAALADLEAIVHPAVNQIVMGRLEEEKSTDHVVVLEVPLLITSDGTPRYPVDGVLVVDVPEEVAISRLVEHRQMDEDDARARIGAQISRVLRLKAADFVILNIGTEDELNEMTENAWRWITELQKEHSQGGEHRN